MIKYLPTSISLTIVGNGRYNWEIEGIVGSKSLKDKHEYELV